MITRLTEDKGQYSIPAVQVRACGFQRGADLLCCPGDGVCVILRDRMTARELIVAAYHLRDATRNLLDLLAEGCGPCRDCSPVCRPLTMIGNPAEVPTDLLGGAGIAAGAKLAASLFFASSNAAAISADCLPRDSFRNFFNPISFSRLEILFFNDANSFSASSTFISIAIFTDPSVLATFSPPIHKKSRRLIEAAGI